MAAAWRSSEVPWPVRRYSDPGPASFTHRLHLGFSSVADNEAATQNWKCLCCFQGAPADLEDGGHQTTRGHSRGLDGTCFPGPGADPALTSGPSPERDSLGGREDGRMNKGGGVKREAWLSCISCLMPAVLLVPPAEPRCTRHRVPRNPAARASRDVDPERRVVCPLALLRSSWTPLLVRPSQPPSAPRIPCHPFPALD